MSETRASVRARSVDVRGGKREIADVLEESRERHNQPVVTLRVERHAMAAAADAPRMPPRAGWTEVVVALPLPMGIGFDRYNASLQPPPQQGLGGTLASAPPAAAPLATGGQRQTALDPLEAVFSPVVWHDMAATSPSGTLDQTWRTSPGFSPSF